MAPTGVTYLELSFSKKDGSSRSLAMANGKREEAKTPELAIDIRVIVPTAAAI